MGTLHKPSFIQCKHIFAIPLSKLQGLTTTQNKQPFMNRLSHVSYKVLVKTAQLPTIPIAWIPTDDLERVLPSVSSEPQNTLSPCEVRDLINTLRVLALSDTDNEDTAHDEDTAQFIDDIIGTLTEASLDESEMEEIVKLINEIGSETFEEC